MQQQQDRRRASAENRWAPYLAQQRTAQDALPGAEQLPLVPPPRVGAAPADRPGGERQRRHPLPQFLDQESGVPLSSISAAMTQPTPQRPRAAPPVDPMEQLQEAIQLSNQQREERVRKAARAQAEAWAEMRDSWGYPPQVASTEQTRVATIFRDGPPRPRSQVPAKAPPPTIPSGIVQQGSSTLAPPTLPTPERNYPAYTADDPPLQYDGTDTECSICQSAFTEGDLLVRMPCFHVLHAGCHDEMIRAMVQRPRGARYPDCPNCRGPGFIISHWRYIGNRPVTGAERISANEAASVASTPPVEHHSVYPGAAGSAAAAVPTLNLPVRMSSQQSDTSAISSRTHTSLFEGAPRLEPSLLTGEPSPHDAPVPNDRPNDFPPEHYVTLMNDLGRHSSIFHANTRLADGTEALLIDPGSVGNLCSSKLSRRVARQAHVAGKKPELSRRDRPLTVAGVGNGAQTCTYDSVLPVAFEKKDGSVTNGHIKMPTVDNSDLPGLLGLDALRRNRAVLDLNTLELHLMGPGDYELSDALPPGTDTYALNLAPSGHLLLPCGMFEQSPPHSSASGSDSSLTLHTRESNAATGPLADSTSASSSSAPAQATRVPVPPPPPSVPPPLPPRTTSATSSAAPSAPPGLTPPPWRWDDGGWSTHPQAEEGRRRHR